MGKRESSRKQGKNSTNFGKGICGNIIYSFTKIWESGTLKFLSQDPKNAQTPK